MELTISTSKKQEMIDITEQVNNIIKEKGTKEGICNVFTQHTTAGIIVNENWDPNICQDIFDALNKAIPPNAGYKHDAVDGNAQSHILTSILSPSENIPIREGKLALGKWQSLMLVETDGGKQRKVLVTIS